MPITTIREYRQVLSTSVADRSASIEDLVSNSNAIINILRRKGKYKSFEGPEIRRRLQIDKPNSQWFRGYDFLANPPLELFGDAVFTPKSMATPISVSGQEIRANLGSSRIVDILQASLDVAEATAVENLDAGVFSDGTADGGKSITGLAAIIPIIPNVGVYGGIDRASTVMWQPGSYDAQDDFPSIGTQVDPTTIRPMIATIMAQRSRGTRAADLLLMSQEHYMALDAATAAIQRIDRPGGLGSLGFTSLEYVYGGRKAEVVLVSGMGTSMPANTTYGINTDSLELLYRKGANFSPLFDDDGQMPINQDALAQYILWEGELVNSNPLFNWQLRDSNPAN